MTIPLEIALALSLALGASGGSMSSPAPDGKTVDTVGWDKQTATLVGLRSRMDAVCEVPPTSLTGETPVLLIADTTGETPVLLIADTTGETPVLREAEQAHTRAVIDEVLARREFTDLRDDRPGLLQRLAEWFAGLLRTIHETLSGLPGWLFWTIVVWLVLTLVALLAHLMYTLWTLLAGQRLGPGDAKRKADREGRQLLGIRDLDFNSVYAEARRLLAAADGPAATKYFYVAAILWLDRQGWIVFRPAKTNRDYLGELRGHPAIQGRLRELTESFESIVYGGQSATVSSTRDIARTVGGLLDEPVRAVAG